ncbi:response regulator [Senegalia massiliensis]|uniref:Stage 0 sporulation protein A homolog n=1 Tax=Senegalia massiliensis TaxID=1720316 RepID=A0A845QYW2_9CLOT|nr:response regulator [Senegalia massiliensis]NBI06358.1 response regulator [Senegalia massiliensis]
MLKLYVVDDDIAIIKSLENIIEDNNLANVVGFSTSSDIAIEEIKKYRPDIVMVDLLMPNIDGIQLVDRIKKLNLEMKFIMVSQVNSKDMISEAYNKGVDFFITKPLNIVEIKKVMDNIIESINMKRTLKNIKNAFMNNENSDELKEQNYDELSGIRNILNKLGIMGEKGAEDIINICSFLIEKDESIFDFKIKEICEKISENSSASEQRIRRAINKALSNLAHLGIEDYMNETFTNYNNSLFNFEDVKSEMDYIRGKRDTGGRISIRKFIDSLMTEIEFRN